MSQHDFSTSTPAGQPVTVLLGWDRPLGQYFLVVELEQDGEGANDEYLYSNLDDPQAWRQAGNRHSELPDGCTDSLCKMLKLLRNGQQIRW